MQIVKIFCNFFPCSQEHSTRVRGRWQFHSGLLLASTNSFCIEKWHQVLRFLGSMHTLVSRLWELRFVNVLGNIKFWNPGPFLKTFKNFKPFFWDVSQENALNKAPNSAQIPWLYGHFYGSRPNKCEATMPQGTPRTKPLSYVSYVGSPCACYISRSSSVSRPFLRRKNKFFENFDLKKNLLIKIPRYLICL